MIGGVTSAVAEITPCTTGSGTTDAVAEITSGLTKGSCTTIGVTSAIAEITSCTTGSGTTGSGATVAVAVITSGTTVGGSSFTGSGSTLACASIFSKLSIIAYESGISVTFSLVDSITACATVFSEGVISFSQQLSLLILILTVIFCGSFSNCLFSIDDVCVGIKLLPTIALATISLLFVSNPFLDKNIFSSVGGGGIKGSILFGVMLISGFDDSVEQSVLLNTFTVKFTLGGGQVAGSKGLNLPQSFVTIPVYGFGICIGTLYINIFCNIVSAGIKAHSFLYIHFNFNMNSSNMDTVTLFV